MDVGPTRRLLYVRIDWSSLVRPLEGSPYVSLGLGRRTGRPLVVQRGQTRDGGRRGRRRGSKGTGRREEVAGPFGQGRCPENVHGTKTDVTRTEPKGVLTEEYCVQRGHNPVCWGEG